MRNSSEMVLNLKNEFLLSFNYFWTSWWILTTINCVISISVYDSKNCKASNPNKVTLILASCMFLCGVPLYPQSTNSFAWKLILKMSFGPHFAYWNQFDRRSYEQLNQCECELKPRSDWKKNRPLKILSCTIKKEWKQFWWNITWPESESGFYQHYKKIKSTSTVCFIHFTVEPKQTPLSEKEETVS